MAPTTKGRDYVAAYKRRTARARAAGYPSYWAQRVALGQGKRPKGGKGRAA